MYVTSDQIKDHLAKVRIEAKKFGFFQPFPVTKPHIFNHRLIKDHDFDFSATDPKKLMLAVWTEKV